jgi:hypothetical protein
MIYITRPNPALRIRRGKRNKAGGVGRKERKKKGIVTYRMREGMKNYSKAKREREKQVMKKISRIKKRINEETK